MTQKVKKNSFTFTRDGSVLLSSGRAGVGNLSYGITMIRIYMYKHKKVQDKILNKSKTEVKIDFAIKP